MAKLTFENIAKNLTSTFKLGVGFGLIGILGYSLCLGKFSYKFLFLFIVLASASFIAGFFLGFLFGIPKRNPDKESVYNLSTNLVDISDWLTKIIIGLGLVEIRQLPGYLQSIGIYIQNSIGGEPSVKIFSTSCIIYFSIFGLYYGYNYMRLFLSAQFKEADDNLLLKLNQKGEELNQKNLTPNSIDKDDLEKVKEYVKLLKDTKIENNYAFDDWFFKGIVSYDQKEFIPTITYMNNALSIDINTKNSAEAFYYIGLAYGELGLYQQAIEATNKVLNNYSQFPELYLACYNNGAFYQKLEEYNKALEFYDKATILNEKDEESWFQKAVVYALMKDKNQLLLTLKKAISLNNDLKDRAKKQKAFEDFQNDADFKALLE